MNVYNIPEGLPNIKEYFPALEWNDLLEWIITVKDENDVIIAESRINRVGCCCVEDKIRIHFINSFGQIDAANFFRSSKDLEVKSESWQKALKFPLSVKSGGSYRRNITSNESFEVETNCYQEKHQDWLSELATTPLAWIEVMLPNGFNAREIKELIPIKITDMKFPLKKMDKRHEYLVKVKFEMSNENISFR